jgi:hypothetical protein
MFVKRLGPDPHLDERLCAGLYRCPDIWELNNGDFAVIGADITDIAKQRLPPSASCGPGERIVRISRLTLVGAKADIPDQA